MMIMMEDWRSRPLSEAHSSSARSGGTFTREEGGGGGEGGLVEPGGLCGGWPHACQESVYVKRWFKRIHTGNRPVDSPRPAR